jgi:NitT/TauT family transport system substrate-binding protein
LIVGLVGCGGTNPAGRPAPKPETTAQNDAPVVRTLANSDYPSWQVFDVAHKLGLVDKDQGKLTDLERKYNVDFVLRRGDYTETISMYGSGAVDAVTITNTDILAPALTREAVAIFPTSTSQGADACLVTGIEKIEDLKGVPIYGAEKSVSEYAFRRLASKHGLESKDIVWRNMDPSAAATAMIQKQNGINAIMVWEPQVEEVLNQRKDAKDIFNSSEIPGEVIDMVVMGRDSYESPGGKEFATFLADVYYQTCRKINTDDKALTQLGEDFAHLDAEQMKVVRSKCKFFDTPEQGIAVFKAPTFPDAMKMISQFSKDRDIIAKNPIVSYLDPSGMGIYPAKADTKPPVPNLSFLTSVMGQLAK